MSENPRPTDAMNGSAANLQTYQITDTETIQRAGLVGETIANTLSTATELDPSLADVLVVPMDANAPLIARAKPAWESDSGKHELHLRMDEGAVQKMADDMKRLPDAVAAIADMLDLSPSLVTPVQLLKFAAAHELGHITEYKDYEDDPQAYKGRVHIQKQSLPIPGVPASWLTSPDGTRYMQDNWPKIQDELGVSSPAEVVEMQQNAYRTLPSEAMADGFATKVRRAEAA